VVIDSVTLRLLRVLVVGLGVALVMSLAAEVLKPLVLAGLLAFLLFPLLHWFEDRGLPRAMSIALVLAVLFAVIGGLGYVVGNQLASLGDHLPTYEANVRDKLEGMKLERGSSLDKAAQTVMRLEKSMHAPGSEFAAPVRIVSDAAVFTWLEHVLGPFEIVLTYGGVVLLLLTFILLEYEDISDRIVQLVGWGKIGVTTKTLNLIGHRLSRYLAALSLVNAGFGVTVMLGLWAIGLPYPALWGFLAGLLRFIPYVGMLMALCLSEVISIAHFPGWSGPLMVIALFVAAELAITVIEPLVYSRSMGVSPIGLLVAALFWTWLWGALGLLLANAMTVCLAVIGQSVPALSFMGTLLRRDVNLDADLRWYQRVLTRDQDGALGLLDDALKARCFEDVCDQIIIPTLARAEQDREQGFIDTNDLRFIYRTVRDWLDGLAECDEVVSPANRGKPGREENCLPTGAAAGFTVVGLASGGGEALILRMINLALTTSGLRIKVLSASGAPLRVSDRVRAVDPALILISHLPPGGLVSARYLIRRLRARFVDVPLAVGYWDRAADLPRVIDQLRTVSVHHVVLNVAAARSFIEDRAIDSLGRDQSLTQSGMEAATRTG
jgi:predicted PurR-regulated permease PerM